MPTENDTRIGVDEDCIPPDLQTSVVLTTFLRLGTRLATVFDRQFSATGIDQALFRALLAVSEREIASDDGANPSRLANYLLLDQTAATALIHRLAATGAIESDTNRLRLTSQGLTTLAEMVPSVITLADKTLAGISHEDLSRLLQILAQMEAGLTE